MNHLLQHTALAALATGLIATFAACNGQYGDPCTFPKAEQLRVCGSSSGDTAGTCVDHNAPDCETKMCATHGEGKPFCTVKCDSDEDCETGSTCEAIVDGASNICIPADRQ